MPRPKTKAKAKPSATRHLSAVGPAKADAPCAMPSAPVLSEEDRLRKRAEFMAALDKILPPFATFRIDEMVKHARRSRTYVFDAISKGRLAVRDGRAARSEFMNFLATECGL
jgi:hypothetical protein